MDSNFDVDSQSKQAKVRARNKKATLKPDENELKGATIEAKLRQLRKKFLFEFADKEKSLSTQMIQYS